MGQCISSNSGSSRIEPQTELNSNRTAKLERPESSARTEELTRLREQKNFLQSQIRTQSITINQQRRDLRTLNSLHRQYTDRITELENKVRLKTNRLGRRAEEQNRLQEQNTIQRDRINELERELRSKTEEIRSLNEQWERLQSHYIIYRNRITELVSESRTLTEQQDSLRRNSRTQANRIIELESESRSKTEEIRRLTEQRDGLRGQRSSNRQLHSDWIISAYELKIRRNECLGRGGWGAVYRAKFHGCHVAVKEMDENIISPHNRQLFEREAEMASRCRHPCLLQFIGATSRANRPLIVTEIMECSLRARLNNQGEPPLSEQEITVISLDVATALNYLHNKREIIIHRDISSSNVLLWRQGDQWRAKLSDYGTVSFQSQSSRNDAGALIYQAPESVNQEPLTDINIKVSAPAL